MRNPFKKRSVLSLARSYHDETMKKMLDDSDRRAKALEPWKDYKPKWQARETIEGTYNLYVEVPQVILGSVPEGDEVVLVWEAVRDERLSNFVYLTPAPTTKFGSIKDVEVFLRRKLHPNNVDFDSNGDRIK